MLGGCTGKGLGDYWTNGDVVEARLVILRSPNACDMMMIPWQGRATLGNSGSTISRDTACSESTASGTPSHVGLSTATRRYLWQCDSPCDCQCLRSAGSPTRPGPGETCFAGATVTHSPSTRCFRTLYHVVDGSGYPMQRLGVQICVNSRRGPH